MKTLADAKLYDKPKRIGRPPIDNPKVAISARVSPDVAAFLKSCDNASQTIDATIRRSKAFRDNNQRRD
jgi:hypothetical protein